MLALGLAHLLIEKQAFDVSFMREWTNGPLLVRSDSGRFLRQSDLQADGRPDVLYACAPDAGELLAYDATRGIWLDDNAHAQLRARIDVAIEHDPEKWEPVFGKRSCSNKKLERDDDSKKGHPALADSLVPCRTAFDIYAAAAAEYSPAQVAEITGVAQAALRKAAAILARAAATFPIRLRASATSPDWTSFPRSSGQKRLGSPPARLGPRSTDG